MVEGEGGEGGGGEAMSRQPEVKAAIRWAFFLFSLLPDPTFLSLGLTSLAKRSNYFSHSIFCSRYLDYLGQLTVSCVLRIAKFMV